METAPIYFLSANSADPAAKPDIPAATVAGTHLLALNGQNRVTRERLLALLTSVYKQAGNRIHAETILFATGALAGAAARAATEHRGAEDFARLAKLPEILEKPNGAKAMKEIALRQLVGSILPGALSIWRIIVGGIIHDGAREIPKIDALWRVTMERKGKNGWGLPVIDPAHAPHEDAFSCFSKLWPAASAILGMENVRRGTAAFEAASVAQILLTKSKDALALSVGANLVMQGAMMTAMDDNLAREIADSLNETGRGARVGVRIGPE